MMAPGPDGTAAAAVAPAAQPATTAPPQGPPTKMSRTAAPSSTASSLKAFSAKIFVDSEAITPQVRPSCSLPDYATAAFVSWQIDFSSTQNSPYEINSAAYTGHQHAMLMQLMFIIAMAYNETKHSMSLHRIIIKKMFKSLVTTIGHLKLTETELTIMESLMETAYSHEGGICTTTAAILPSTPGFCKIKKDRYTMEDDAGFYFSSPLFQITFFSAEVRKQKSTGDLPQFSPGNIQSCPLLRSGLPLAIPKAAATSLLSIVNNQRNNAALTMAPPTTQGFVDSWEEFYDIEKCPHYWSVIQHSINSRNNKLGNFSSETLGSLFVSGGHSTKRVNSAMAFMHRIGDFTEVTGTSNHPDLDIFRTPWTAVSPIVFNRDEAALACVLTLNPFFTFINSASPTQHIGTRDEVPQGAENRTDDWAGRQVVPPAWSGFKMTGPMYQLTNVGIVAHYKRQIFPSLS